MRIILTSFIALVFVVSCSSKKPVEPGADGLVTGEGMNNPSVTGTDIVPRDLKMDPCGSDCSTDGSGLTTVHFPYDSSNLTEETKSALAKNAEWLKSNPTVAIQVEGHCDAKGSDEYNRSLGARRADVVKSYLKGLGVDSNRLTTLSWGEEKPLALGDSEADHAKNRRANFAPVMQ